MNGKMITAFVVIPTFVVLLVVSGLVSQRAPPVDSPPSLNLIAQGVQRAYAATDKLVIEAELRRSWQENSGGIGNRHYRAVVEMEPDRLKLLVYDEARGGELIFERETSAGAVIKEAAYAPEIDGCLFGTLEDSWVGPDKKRPVSTFVERITAGRYLGTATVAGQKCYMIEHWIEEPGAEGEPAYFRRDVFSIDARTSFLLRWLTEEDYNHRDASPLMRCERLYTTKKGD